MFIVYQNETEVAKLNHAYVTDCDIMHFGLDQRTSELIASYNTHEEAQCWFCSMIDFLLRERPLYAFPPQRPTSPSEPSNP